jgi:hypothetical protein
MTQWTWAALAGAPTGVVGLAVVDSPLIAASMAGLGARYGTAELWPWLLPTPPLAIFGPWLAALDLDVQRLPDKLRCRWP